MKTSEKIKAAKEFAEYWKGKGYEKGESAPFWLSLLTKVYGVRDAEQFIKFEEQVHLDHTSFIDGWIPSTHILIEQKSIDKDLKKKIKQSDGIELTPFEQAKRYSLEIPYSERPRWIITCNFKTFLIYDMENPRGEPQEILLENLGKEYYRLDFITDIGNEHIQKETEVSLKAGELVGKIYEGFSKQYVDINNPHSIQSLNKLCVRLVFCLYAEDAGIFGRHGMFHDYLKTFDYKHQRQALIDLFKVLDTPYNQRDPYIDESLAEFPYVNGGMFSDENIEIPQLTEDLSKLILSKASDEFDWSEISPTIFGAVFESTLNPETRRSQGMHFSPIESIHKVIDPLFLNDLYSEFEEIEASKRDKESKLYQFQNKLSQLKFLDPACGSGNFLTETYLCLRKLENKIIKLLNKDQIEMGFDGTNHSPIKVSINQFYGIEINDFAVSVAKTALWIAESQMLEETKSLVLVDLDFLPLKNYPNIIAENALRFDWNRLIRNDNLNYIIGNPPFLGARLMNSIQKEDLMISSNNLKKVNNLDYVSGWYFKCADYIKNTSIHCGLVSTNSITQGEQPAILWKYLFSKGIIINYAYRTFRWTSESFDPAAVYCVIIGFSYIETKKKYIFDGESVIPVNKINAYLLDADNIVIESRTKPLCDVPSIGIGNQPIDNGNYIFSEEDKEEFIKKEPKSEKFFKRWFGSDEFINGKIRYCLWLGDATPNELAELPECCKRIKAVIDFRLSSSRKITRELASFPRRFGTENIPTSDFIVLPEVSTISRNYIPIGFLTSDNLCSNLVKIMPNATLYHFGVLTSNVHMAWIRAIGGRFGNQYRYSKDIVYNNFPWPKISDEKRKKIEKSANAILESRSLFPEASLGQMYDEEKMPPELRKAHQANDKAVMDAYGFKYDMTEQEIAIKLIDMYKELID